MSDQTPLDVEAIRENIRLYELNDGGDTPAQGEYTDSDLAVRDIRRLLDENARLNAENERIRAMTKLHRESSARQRRNLERKLIGWREAAEKAARERDERPSRRDLLIAEEQMRSAEEGRNRADRQIRVHLDIARAAEAERDALAAKLGTVAADALDKLADTLENLPPGGEALKGPHWYREGVKAAAAIARDEAYHLRPAASEMPRPTAVEAEQREPWIPSMYGNECPHRPEWTCPEHAECRACECNCNTYVADLEEPDLTLIPAELVVRDPEICSGRPTMRGTRILASRIAGELAAGTSWQALHEWYPSMPIPAALVAAPALAAPERDTGVREAHGSAQAGEETESREWIAIPADDVDDWSIHAGLGGEVSIINHRTRAHLGGKDIPLGAALAFIADQQEGEDR